MVECNQNRQHTVLASRTAFRNITFLNYGQTTKETYSYFTRKSKQTDFIVGIVRTKNKKIESWFVITKSTVTILVLILRVQ